MDSAKLGLRLFQISSVLPILTPEWIRRNTIVVVILGVHNDEGVAHCSGVEVIERAAADEQLQLYDGFHKLCDINNIYDERI